MSAFNPGDRVRAVVSLDNVDGKPVPAGTIGIVTGDLEVGNGLENPAGVNFGAEFHDPDRPFPCFDGEIEAVQP